MGFRRRSLWIGLAEVFSKQHPRSSPAAHSEESSSSMGSRGIDISWCNAIRSAMMTFVVTHEELIWDLHLLIININAQSIHSRY
mmetsp:Transcript_9312/g.12962  ORF Transcript_9312/g.12962 Transcript_9312/m.12962 type:complete len:84 (+) Transcript_9312:1344-1595(+)